MVEALRTTVDPEARDKAIVEVYNHRFTYKTNISSQLADALAIKTEIQPRGIIVQGTIVGKCPKRGKQESTQLTSQR